MKTNQDYKNAALARIRGNWAPLVVATIVFFFFALLCMGADADRWEKISKVLPSLAFFVPATAAGKAIMGGCSALLLIFVLGPLVIGYANMTRIFYEEGHTATVSNLFHFALGNYIHIVWGYFLMILKIFLWTLLLIIPGIIKTYEYALTPYILVERPEMSASQAIAESSRLMEGHKFDLFWLELSFIGWFILSVITLGIGFIWLEPYCQVSIAAFYNDLKAADAAPVVDEQ